MPQGGFLEQKPKSPGSLAAVLALHVAVLGAVMLAKNEIQRERPEPLIVKSIPNPPQPPPPPERQPRTEAPQQKSEIRYVPPQVPAPRRDPVVLGNPSEVPIVSDTAAIGDAEPQAADPLPPAPLPPPNPPMPDPLRVEARLDPGSELQPPYPPSEERAGREGAVTVRIVIGSNGRVTHVEKVRATSEAFYRATEQQALRHWRFKPATLDGQPVESRTITTVRFRLTD